MLGTWAAANSSLGLGTLKPGDRALAQSDPFLLRNRGQDADDSLPKDSGAVEILLSKRSVVDSVPGEPLEVVERFHSALATKALHGPEEQAVELTPGRGREHLLELVTISVLAACLVLVLVNDSPALSRRELPKLAKLAELVFRVLSSISGRYPRICSHSHDCLSCTENERYLRGSKTGAEPYANRVAA
jgi:hypothetical protein